MKTASFSINDVYLVIEGDNNGLSKAFASLTLNPNVTWAKLILTDDAPNANSQQIPSSEFENVINTGTYMPIKMAYHEISEGHDGTYPVGVLTHLKKVDNRIEALAALWNFERDKDIAHLKELFAEGESLEVSWELNYKKSDIIDEVEILQGISMNAVTIVGNPAYAGRTPIVALAGAKITEDDVMTIELKEHKRIVETFEATIAQLQTKVDAAAKVEILTDEIKTELAELETLRKFKSDIDAEAARAEKLEVISTKLTEAGLELEDNYVTEREDHLLSMSDNDLDFFIQELLAFRNASKQNEDNTDGAASASITSKSVPSLQVGDDKLLMGDLIRHLEEQE